MSTIKSSAEDLTLNADGSNEVKFQINAVEKASINSSGLFTSTTIDATKLTGNLPAISGASLTGLPTKRNFIIDGDFTQWPEGTGAVTATDRDYNHALIGTYLNSTGTFTTEQSTDVPTFAESAWQSQFSVLTKCTGTDASPAVAEHNSLRYHVTGSDFDSLDQREVTISFWCKTAGANTGDTYTLFLANSAFNRCYVTDFTATSSWAKITKTITLDASGTWLKTDADIGLTVGICLQTGSNYHGTADTWEGGIDLGTSNTSNFMDSTSNEFYISQFKLELGDSATSFVGDAIATVKSQVAYYVEKQNAVANDVIGVSVMVQNTTLARVMLAWRQKRTMAPSVTFDGAASNYRIYHAATSTVCSALPTITEASDTSGYAQLTVASGLTGGQAGVLRMDAGSPGFIIDSRH